MKLINPTYKVLPLLLAIAVLLAATINPAGAAEPARFFSAVDDLPVMTGLAEVGEGVHFEGPQGRIVEAQAEGRHSPTEVLDFYGATLPQLGWRVVGRGQFRREGEALALKVEDLGAGRARLSLSVRPAANP